MFYCSAFDAERERQHRAKYRQMEVSMHTLTHSTMCVTLLGTFLCLPLHYFNLIFSFWTVYRRRDSECFFLFLNLGVVSMIACSMLGVQMIGTAQRHVRRKNSEKGWGRAWQLLPSLPFSLFFFSCSLTLRCTPLSGERLEQTDHYTLLGNCPPTSHLGQNVGLGEG